MFGRNITEKASNQKMLYAVLIATKHIADNNFVLQ